MLAERIKMKKQDDPLIKINWGRLKRYLNNILKGIIKLGEVILKTILKILTFILRMLIAIYKRLSKFAKSKQKGFWILFLLFVLLLSVFITLEREIKYRNFLIDVEKNEQKYKELLNDYVKLDNQVKEIEEKLKSQSNNISKPVVFGVEPYRYLVAKYFPPKQVDNALAIMACESGGNYQAVNYSDTKRTGYPSWGLFQINGPDNWNWDNPEENVSRAVTIFYTRGWQAWKNCARNLGLI